MQRWFKKCISSRECSRECGDGVGENIFMDTGFIILYFFSKNKFDKGGKIS